MTKTYKHKTLGWIAKREELVNSKYFGQYSIWKTSKTAHISEGKGGQKEMYVYMMYPELIENSQDREEVIEKNLVPKTVKFMESYLQPLGLEVGKQQQIIFYKNTRQITNNKFGGRAPIQCKLEKKKLSDVKVGDFVVDIYGSVDDEKSYILVTSVHKDGYEGMFYNNRALCYMSISALSDDPYVVVPLDNY